MKLFAILMFMLALAAGSSEPGQTDMTEHKSCKDHPKVIGSCFTVYGRLSAYNGAPTLRIWKIGTRRMLGVSEQRFQEDGYINIPDEIRNRVNFETDLLGNFLICPFTRQRTGEMQLVCIESGKNLETRKRK
ncbi:MAG TPA: hypothetical protein VFH91_07195 [Pyrinomonadaceae bacterium]|nr:hypothetical protein [Pyrinomonadaceae bacterium]